MGSNTQASAVNVNTGVTLTSTSVKLGGANGPGALAGNLNINGGTAVLGGINPVSYTHLDVYKRQDVAGARTKVTGTGTLTMGNGSTLHLRNGNAAGANFDMKIDVYKRQARS